MDITYHKKFNKISSNEFEKYVNRYPKLYYNIFNAFKNLNTEKVLKNCIYIKLHRIMQHVHYHYLISLSSFSLSQIVIFFFLI